MVEDAAATNELGEPVHFKTFSMDELAKSEHLSTINRFRWTGVMLFNRFLEQELLTDKKTRKTTACGRAARTVISELLRSERSERPRGFGGSIPQWITTPQASAAVL